MTASDRACFGLAVLAGSYAGVTGLHATDMSPVLGLLVVTGALLGFAGRRLFWLWALVVGGSVPLADCAAALFHVTRSDMSLAEGFATDFAFGTIAVAVAMIAAAAGASLALVTSRTN
jgi:hypothetical protein